VVDLIAKTPCDGLLPLTVGDCTVSELDLGKLTSCAPFKGQSGAFAETMKDAHGLAVPKVNRSTGKQGARLMWFSQGQYLLAGPAPDDALAKTSALTDQSDAWAAVRIEGPNVEDVLARLVPIDLRPVTFKRGHVARTQVQHMMALILRLSGDAFQIMVFRSMAATLVHDLQVAMQGVAARREG
jgi:sarcosine oxidase subunit gamma